MTLTTGISASVYDTIRENFYLSLLNVLVHPTMQEGHIRGCWLADQSEGQIYVASAHGLIPSEVTIFLNKQGSDI